MLNNECQDDVIACCSELPREERQEKKFEHAQYADRYSFFSDVFEQHLVKCKDKEPTGSEVQVCRLTLLEVSSLDWLDFSQNLSLKSRYHLGWTLLTGAFGKELFLGLLRLLAGLSTFAVVPLRPMALPGALARYRLDTS